jgi:LPS export ABC transporter protein LptC
MGLVELALLTAVIAGCGRPASGRSPSSTAQAATKPARKSLKGSSNLRVVTHGVKELSWQSGGQYIMRAKAKTLVADEETGKARLQDAHAILFKDGKQAATLSSDLIEADVNASKLTATGGITARSLVRDVQFRAQSLTWMNKKNRITGDGGVTVTSSAGNLSADGLEGDTALKQITLHSRRGGRASINVAALEQGR